MKISFKKFYILMFASFSLNVMCFNNANCMQKSECKEIRVKTNEDKKIDLKDKGENKKSNLKKSIKRKKPVEKKTDKNSDDFKKEDVKLSVKDSGDIKTKEKENKEKTEKNNKEPKIQDSKEQNNKEEKKVQQNKEQNNKEEKKVQQNKEQNDKEKKKQNASELNTTKKEKSEFESLLETFKELISSRNSDSNVEENKEDFNSQDCFFPFMMPMSDKMSEVVRNKFLLHYNIPFKDSLGLNIENDAKYEWSKIFRDIFYNECTLEDFRRFGNLKTIKERDDFLQGRFLRIIERYRGKIYDSRKFKILNMGEIYQFMNEITEKRYCDVLNDEDMFYRQRFLNDHMVEGFKLIDWISKLRHGYFIFEDEETKIKVVVILYGKGLDNVIFLRKPTEDALEEYKKIKDKDIKREVTDDGIIITVDIFSKDLLKSIYQLMKQQYFDDPGNILIIVRDASSYERGRKKSMLDWVDFDHNRYDKIMENLKENLFSKLYDDNYGDFDIKKEPKKITEKEVLKYSIEESDNKKIFNIDGTESKFLAEVTYHLEGDARYKDVFNFDSEAVNRKIEEDKRFVNLRKYMMDRGVNYIEFVPQNEKEILKVKFYGDDEKIFSSKDNMKKISNTIVAFIVEKFFIPDVKNGVSFYEGVKNLNIVLKSYNDYCKDHRKLEKYIDEKEKQNCFYDHVVIENMPKLFELPQRLVTIPIDCCPKYRGYIPIIPLIIESFSKYNVPFSNKIFDMDNKYIEDYLLRVIENLYDASLNGEKIVKDVIRKSPFDIKVLKNKNID